MLLKEIKNAAVSLFVLTVITGIAYPLFVTGVAQLVFPHQANGSMLENNKGSELIGQSFEKPQYFWGRLSACNYNAVASSGSNYAMTNPALIDAAKVRIEALKSADPDNSQPIPVDLVTASGSGLDPQISIAAAKYQAARVAKARGLPVQTIMELIDETAQDPGILGRDHVNVVQLNLRLDSRNLPLSNAMSQSHVDHRNLTRSIGFLPH